MSGGPVRPCLGLEVDTRAEAWRCCTLFAFDSRAEELAVSIQDGSIHLQRGSARLIVTSRWG